MDTSCAEVIKLDVEKQWRTAQDAYSAYKSKTVEFGRIMAELRPLYPHGTWGAELEKRGFNHSFVATAIKAASDPAWWETRKEATRAASRAAKKARSNFVVEDKVSSPPSPLTSGEAHEALLGLKAAIHRAKSRPAQRMQWVSTARGHLKKLVELSGMPEALGVSLDDFMKLRGVIGRIRQRCGSGTACPWLFRGTSRPLRG